MNCRNTPKNTRCSSGVASLEKIYTPFNICLPLGGSLEYDGLGLTYRPGASVPDGVYGSLRIENNCITGFLPTEIPTITPAPCASAPTPCSDPESEVIIAPGSDNLTTRTNGQLLTKLYTQNGDNITMEGNGTIDSPLIIASTITPNDTKIISDTPNILPITGTGAAASPYRIAHAQPSGIGGPYDNGFTLDSAGHVIKYDKPTATSIMDIQGTPNVINATNAGGVVVLNLPAKFEREEVIEAGNYKVTVDVYGRITAVEVASGDLAPAGRHSTIFEGSRESVVYQFTSVVGGRIRGTYKGYLGTTATGSGLVTLPASIVITIDQQSVQAFGTIDSDGNLVGFDFLTSTAYASGVHIVSITYPTAVTTPGVLDIELCL